MRLNPKAGIRATVLDIIDNAKKLRIIELDSAQLPRSLEDLDAAAINASYAEPAGLTPAKDGIAKNAPTAPTPTSSASAPRTSPSPGSPSSSSATTPPKSRHL